MESPSPVDGLHLQHGGFLASRGAHELMPPGEILSLKGAGTQGMHRWVSLCSLPSSMELGGGVYPGSQRGLGEMSPGCPPSGDLSLTHLPWPFPLPSLPTSHINCLYPSPYLRVGLGGTQATVDRMMSPNTSMPPSPRTYEYVTIDDRTSSLGVIKLSTLRWGEDAGFSRGTHRHHKRPYKRETRRSKSERGDMRADPEGGAMCFEGEHRAVGQGMQLLASRS